MEEKTFENSQAYELILGSASPRRNELMQHTYLPFTVDIADLAENSLFEKPVEVVQDLAIFIGSSANWECLTLKI